MKPKLIPIGVVIVILLSLIACSPASRQISIKVSCDDLMASKHINLKLDLPVTDSLKVSLCSNPTTGFIWPEEAEISDKTVLEQTDHKYEPPEDENIVGGAGEEVWTFKALKEGKSTISMEYS